MDSTRQHKVSRLIQKDLGTFFQRESKNLFKGAMITVTKVAVSKDLGVAKVYLSLFSTESKELLIEDIREHAREIRFKLGQQIGKQVRVVPELHFYEDDSLDYIDNINRLLDE